MLNDHGEARKDRTVEAVLEKLIERKLSAGASSVAQIGLRTGFPFPRRDSPHSFRYGNAERREAVQDGDTNLELGDLT
ncbi:MAG: hypothetical protein ACXIUV_14545, partial [Alkalilacustris sp.]